ncbi:MAG: RHS repeat-associated core domain-containing protein, partial [Proteobacteria bacterium]|nr:RHS repeat-associated core domain-containing protein [Pseudomonadota bacterium]
SGSGASAQTLSYLIDALRSTVRLTNQFGAKVVDYTYDPYGNTTADAIVDNPFQYTGRENDGTGLYFYRARYYSPSQQRFISEDPIGLRGGINVYGYVGGESGNVHGSPGTNRLGNNYLGGYWMRCVCVGRVLCCGGVRRDERQKKRRGL